MRRDYPGDPLARLPRLIRSLAVPTVAVIDGYALGAGAALAGASTFAVATSRSVFGLPEGPMGFFPYGVVPFLSDRVAAHIVLEWGLSARKVPAEEAARAGLVTHLVEEADGLQHGAADDFQALGTEFIDGILRDVPEDVVIAVVEVDEVRAGDAPLYEGKMVIVHGHGSREEMRLIAQPGGRLIDHGFEPCCRIRIMLDVEIGISDHIGQEESFDFLQGSVGFPFFLEVTDTVEAVLEERHLGGVGLYRLLGVVPYQPDAVAVARPAAALVLADLTSRRLVELPPPVLPAMPPMQPQTPVLEVSQ